MLFLPEYFKTESDIIDYNYIVFTFQIVISRLGLKYLRRG